MSQSPSDDLFEDLISSTISQFSRLEITDDRTTRSAINFMDLPFEIRENLYKHALRIGAMSILQVSKQVNEEASPFIRNYAYLRLDDQSTSSSRINPDYLDVVDLSRVKNISINSDFWGHFRYLDLCKLKGFYASWTPYRQNLEITFSVPARRPDFNYLLILLYHLEANQAENLFITLVGLTEAEARSKFINHEVLDYIYSGAYQERSLDQIVLLLLRNKFGPGIQHKNPKEPPPRLDSGNYLEFHPYAYQKARHERRSRRVKMQGD